MTPEQRRQQAEWDARLARGECSLEDALMMALHAGLPASPSLIARVEAAFNDQREGRRPLAESFGSGSHGNTRQAIESELLKRQVVSLVDELHQRHPKGHPEHLSLGDSAARTRKSGHTAHSKAAEILAMTERAVLNQYYGKRKSLPRDKG